MYGPDRGRRRWADNMGNDFSQQPTAVGDQQGIGGGDPNPGNGLDTPGGPDEHPGAPKVTLHLHHAIDGGAIFEGDAEDGSFATLSLPAAFYAELGEPAAVTIEAAE